MTVAETEDRMPVAARSTSMPSPVASQTESEFPPTLLPGFDTTEQCSWQNYSDAATHLYAVLNRELLDVHGLSLLDVILLGVLSNAGGYTRMGALAHRLAVIPSRLSQQVGRLEDELLVRRSKCPEDRRVVMASITHQGRLQLNVALATYAKAVRVLYLNPLSRQQMTALGDSSRRISGALKESKKPRKKAKKGGRATS